MKTKITIRRWGSWNTIFSYTCENNTIRKTVEEAIKQHVNLSYANLQYANLSCLNLSNVNLSYADLSYANLAFTNLSNSNLSNTNLQNASLIYSDLSNALLLKSDLTNSRLYDASKDSIINLTNAYLIGVKGLNDQCPKTGSFIGWKKCINKNNNTFCIVKLEIPSDAKRFSGTDIKCRCNKAKVLEIQNLDGSIIDIKEVFSFFNEFFIYKINEYVYPDYFDDIFFKECSHGIHFFMNREDAVNYMF